MTLAANATRFATTTVMLLPVAAFAAGPDESLDKSPEAAKPRSAQSAPAPKQVWIEPSGDQAECHSEPRPGSRISATRCEPKKTLRAVGERDGARSKLEALRAQQIRQEQIRAQTIAERVHEAGSEH
jgi:hypothetical protein